MHYFSKRRKRGDQSERLLYLLCLGQGRTWQSDNFESVLSLVAACMTLKKYRMQDRHSTAGSPEADAHLAVILSGVTVKTT